MAEGKLLKEGLIKDENVYNHPKYIKQSGSKAEFHKIVDGDENIPQTCHSKEEALKIGFPLIAKPADGHSGPPPEEVGVQHASLSHAPAAGDCLGSVRQC